MRRIALILAGAGIPLLFSACGDKEDYQARCRDLEERHRAEIARLTSRHESEAKEWRRQAYDYENRLAALRDRLGGKKGAPAVSAPPPPEKAPAAASALSEAAPEAVEAPAVSPVSAAAKIEAFANDYALQIEEGRREKFVRDFNAYAATLKPPAAGDAEGARERTLAELESRIASAASEREREELQRRQEAIRNVSAEDLPAVLAYYRGLDSFQELDELMDEYNISREELRSRGVEPPPRSSWGPEPREIAYNLKNFVDAYAPLTDPSRREEYRKDFADYLSGLASRPSDEEIQQKRTSLLAELETRAASETGVNPERLERRREFLRTAEPEILRRMIQGDSLQKLNALVEKYGIPANELRDSGVPIQRARTGGRPRR